jgi:hypothetical protein
MAGDDKIFDKPLFLDFPRFYWQTRSSFMTARHTHITFMLMKPTGLYGLLAGYTDKTSSVVLLISFGIAAESQSA